MVASEPHFLLFSRCDHVPPAEQAGESRDPAACGWRFVLQRDDGSSRLEAADTEEAADASRLALLALVRGLEALDQPSRVTLMTPSRYVSRGLRFGLQHWRENDWCWESFGEMAPVKNRDLWQRVDRALRFHRVECRRFRVDAAHGPVRSRRHRLPSQAAGTRRRAGSEVREARAEGSADAGRVGQVTRWVRGVAVRFRPGESLSHA